MRLQQTDRSSVVVRAWSRNDALGPTDLVDSQQRASHRVSYEAGVRGLLIGCGKGDVTALGCLYDETIGWVYLLARRVQQDESSAAALTTDAYRRIWIESPRFDPRSGCAVSWIHRQIREALTATSE